MKFVFKVIWLLSLLLLTSSCADYFEKESSAPTVNGSNKGTPNTDFEIQTLDFFKNINQGNFSRKKMLGNLLYNVSRNQVKNFSSYLDFFKTAVNKDCGQSDINFSRSLGLWEGLVESFTPIYAIPFGPMLSPYGSKKQLRSLFYSYPFLNKCMVERLSHPTSPFEFSDRIPVNAQGLSAIEYLIFDSELATSCGQNSPWTQLNRQQKLAGRCTLLKKYTEKMVEITDHLVEQWQPAAYPSKAIADDTELSTLTNMFQGYLQLEVIKDLKIAKPMGLYKDCSADLCPEDLEFRQSKQSFTALLGTYKYAANLFSGAGGFGIDHYLNSIGRSNESEEFLTALHKTIDILEELIANGEDLESLMTSFDTQTCTTSEQPLLCQLYASADKVGGLLKTDILMALSLQVTLPSPGDTDGV